jgi:hypothetical protein
MCVESEDSISFGSVDWTWRENFEDLSILLLNLKGKRFQSFLFRFMLRTKERLAVCTLFQNSNYMLFIRNIDAQWIDRLRKLGRIEINFMQIIIFR